MNEFVKQYLISALWSSTGDDDEPLDKDFSILDLATSATKKAIEDCEKFQEKAAKYIATLDESQVAHDFWLTRNGHGAGFWDGDYDEDIGEILNDIAKSFGEITLYAGDDKKLYFM